MTPDVEAEVEDGENEGALAAIYRAAAAFEGAGDAQPCPCSSRA